MQRSDFYKANEAMTPSVAAKINIVIALIETVVLDDKSLSEWLNYKGPLHAFLQLKESGLGKELF